MLFAQRKERSMPNYVAIQRSVWMLPYLVAAHTDAYELRRTFDVYNESICQQLICAYVHKGGGARITRRRVPWR